MHLYCCTYNCDIPTACFCVTQFLRKRIYQETLQPRQLWFVFGFVERDDYKGLEMSKADHVGHHRCATIAAQVQVPFSFCL